MKKLLFSAIGLLLLASSVIASAQAAPVISWTYATADVTTYGVTSFSIERKTEACAGTAATWAAIASAPATARSIADPAVVVAGSTYCYRVAAVSALGQGPYSNTAEKTIIGLPPAPTAVTVN